MKHGQILFALFLLISFQTFPQKVRVWTG